MHWSNSGKSVMGVATFFLFWFWNPLHEKEFMSDDVSWTHQNPKQLGKERVYVILRFLVIIHHWMKSWQELKQKAWKNTAYWLDFHDLVSLLTYTTLGHWATGSGVAPSHINYSSRKWPTDLPTGNLDEDIFSIESPSSHMTLAYIKLS